MPPSQPPPARKRPTSSNPPVPPRASGTGGAPAAAHPGSSPAKRPATTCKLVCVAGPKAGTEFPLVGEEDVVIGRATENAVSIPDTSVSRRHAQLRNVPDGWAVSDLGSGNGTLVNGERLDKETVLRNGDVIALGDTELKFEIAGETDRRPMPSRPRPSLAGGAPLARRNSMPGRPDVRARLSRSGAPVMDPAAALKRKRLMIVGAGVLVVIVIGLVGVKRLQDKKNAALQVQAGALQQQRQVLSEMFQTAKNLVREGKWQEAKAKLEEIKGVKSDYPGVDDYLERANKEIPNERNLTLTNDALQKGDMAAAVDALTKVTEDTQMFQRRETLRRDLDSRMAKLMSDAQVAMGNNDVDQVKSLTDIVLKAQPNNRDAKAMNDQAAAAIAKRNEPKPVIQGPAPKPWEPGVLRFIDGDFVGAIALEDECTQRKVARCKSTASEMREFAATYNKLDELDTRGLKKLLALDHDITDGRRSKTARNAGVKLAGALCKSATAAKAAAQFAQAGEKATEALKADPGNACATNILSDLKIKAHEMYMSAYSEKDSTPEEAIEKFRQVIQMTLPDSDDHQKAQSWLQKLQGQ
jgi:tetratricopeptide (TPR) repeat protein